MQKFLEKNLTETEQDLIRTLRKNCMIDGRKTFSSDTFRMLGLERFLRGDSQHSIGAFFARLKHHGVIEEDSWVRSKLKSNNMRKIRVWRWKK